jgi:hypothetical protein
VAFPVATVQWQHPSTAFSFLANGADLLDQRYKGRILQTTLTHLNIIKRSSFHQTVANPSSDVPVPMNDQMMYKLRDHAHYHFLDRALVAFELREDKGRALRDVREVFPRMWGDGSWSV